MEEYTTKFEFPMLRHDIVEIKEQKLAWYLDGLKEKFCNVVWLSLYWIFNDVRKLALNMKNYRKRLEKMIKKTISKKSSSNRGVFNSLRTLQ
jgi:hypothetical protein